MASLRVDPAIAGTRFRPFEFGWDWRTTQLLARAAGASLDDPRDAPLLLPGATRPGHPMIPFNGALLARNRAEVMDVLIGGYDNWQAVGRWGSARMSFRAPIPGAGSGRVECAISEVGATSKGHATVGFSFSVFDRETNDLLVDGWMLLFLLDCAPAGAGKLEAPTRALPQRDPDLVVPHPTPANTTLDWALAADDWNATHFATRGPNPAPLIHGPRNLSLVLHDAARAFLDGHLEKITAVDLGSLPSPHFCGECTETSLWRGDDGALRARLVVPGAARRDGAAGDKVLLDKIEIATS
jgi:hypothetical protein